MLWGLQGAPKEAVGKKAGCLGVSAWAGASSRFQALQTQSSGPARQLGRWQGPHLSACREVGALWGCWEGAPPSHLWGAAHLAACRGRAVSQELSPACLLLFSVRARLGRGLGGMGGVRVSLLL